MVDGWCPHSVPHAPSCRIPDRDIVSHKSASLTLFSTILPVFGAIGNKSPDATVIVRYDAGMAKTDTPDRDENVGAFVRRRRRANRLTQRQLAELAGMGVRFVSDLERGKSTVRLDAVNAVLAIFGKQLGVVPRGTPT